MELIYNAWENESLTNTSPYGKYITKEKDYYYLNRTIQNLRFYYGIFKDLDKAKKYREQLIEYGWDEEKVGLTTNHIFETDYGYNIFKIINNYPEYFGTFNTEEEALEAEEFLKENSWSKKELGVDIYEKFITFNGDKFVIEKMINHKIKKFGSYKILENAIKKRDELIKNNWNIPIETKNNHSNKFKFTNKMYSPNQKKAITLQLNKLFDSKLPTDQIYELEKYMNYLTRSKKFDVRKFNSKFNEKFDKTMFEHKYRKCTPSQKRAITIKKKKIEKSKLPKIKKSELERYVNYLTRSKDFNIKTFNEKFDKKYDKLIKDYENL